MTGAISLREFIIAYNGNWIHFFIKQHVGLCMRKKDGFKFEEYRVLMQGAEADFCVYTSEDLIHIVCQNEKGSVIYLLYDGIAWKKTVLLESRTAKPYNKHFQMTEISGHINLLYVVENKDRLMLAHQILNGTMPLDIVDYIKKDSVPFCLANHQETDFSVFYTNENNIPFQQTYKWSQKKFLEPIALCNYNSVKFAVKSEDGFALAVIQKTSDTNILAYCEKDKELLPVYSDCDKSIIPIISHYCDKLYMVWTEYGNVMSSYLEGDRKWSKPMRYAKSLNRETKLYAICKNGTYEYYYGTQNEYDITLYGTHDILKKPPTETIKKINPHRNNTKYEESMLIAQEKQIKLLCQELSQQRQRLSDLSEKIDELLNAVPLADEEAIDNVLLN